MTTGRDAIALADWRRSVSELYAAVRQAPIAGREIAWHEWRAGRNDLFRNNSQSPLEDEQRRAFDGLRYYDYDPGWRLEADLDYKVASETFEVHLETDGAFRYTRTAVAQFSVGDTTAALSLFWIEGYGGGLFLPFKDLTNGKGTFSGGRYLCDTIKGADLGLQGDRIVLDFNYAYNPSCAYHSRWVCPLPPPENVLPFAVTAGEMVFRPQI